MFGKNKFPHASAGWALSLISCRLIWVRPSASSAVAVDRRDGTSGLEPQLAYWGCRDAQDLSFISSSVIAPDDEHGSGQQGRGIDFAVVGVEDALSQQFHERLRFHVSTAIGQATELYPIFISCFIVVVLMKFGRQVDCSHQRRGRL